MTLPESVRVDARAKVNLYLHVVGRRPDGYHLLDSLVVFPDIGDVIEVAPADMGEIMKKYPEAFAREYDPASGLRFDAWIESG